MVILSLSERHADEAVSEALKVLRNGGIVAYPTESFYALGVAAVDETAVHRLFGLKKRPLDKAMPVIVGDKTMLRSVVKSIPARSMNLMDTFWPGALTLVFDARDYLPRLLIGRNNKIAVRIPGLSFALSLAGTADFPITATSANISGSTPARHPDEIVSSLKKNVDLIINAGGLPGGKPSTIVDVTVDPPILLREGKVILNLDSLQDRV
jgi:L-threonylcarbamoyladenylate synthase